MGWIQKNDGRVCSEGYSIEFEPLVNGELDLLRLVCEQPMLVCLKYPSAPETVDVRRLESMLYIHTIPVSGEKTTKRAHITCRGAIFLAELERNNALGLD